MFLCNNAINRKYWKLKSVHSLDWKSILCGRRNYNSKRKDDIINIFCFSVAFSENRFCVNFCTCSDCKSLISEFLEHKSHLLPKMKPFFERESQRPTDSPRSIDAIKKTYYSVDIRDTSGDRSYLEFLLRLDSGIQEIGSDLFDRNCQTLFIATQIIPEIKPRITMGRVPSFK